MGVYLRGDPVLAIGRVRLAVFDLDGTLVTGDSLRAFVRFVLCREPRSWATVAAVVGGVLGAVRAPDPAARVKEALLAVINPLGPAEQTRLVQEFVGVLLGSALRPEVAALIPSQAAAGRRPVLVSASPDLYVRPLGARLGFDWVLCTRLLERPDGGKGNRIVGQNVKGPAKIAALLAQAGDTPIDWAGSFACSDHHSDLPLLERVGERLAVHPERHLRARAQAAAWRILS